MTSKDSHDSPFPPPVSDSEEEQEQLVAPSNPDEFMHGILDELGFRYVSSEPMLENIEPYAHGGTGEIFTAQDSTLGRTVAVKTLRAKHQYSIDQIERLVREAKAAAQLEHPNIVPIHSIGVSPSRGVYFTMKRLRGDSLRHIVTQLSLRNPAYTRVYTGSVLISIFMKICQGINYAHSKGIIHRDLKPENILVGNYGEVTIIDWGLVKKMDVGSSTHVPGRRKPMGLRMEPVTASVAVPRPPKEAGASRSTTGGGVSLPSGNLTQNGQLNGTPRFMSPEQVNGDVEDIDTRSDIYALGIILYELLTFRNPFEELADENEIFDAVARGRYLRPRQTERKYSISPELEAICLKAMSVNKESRYQAVGELIKDLTAHQEGLPVSSYEAPMYVRVMKFAKRNPIKTSAILSCIVAVFMYFMVSSFLDSLYYKRTMRQVQVSVATAEFKLDNLDKRLMKDKEAAQAVLNGAAPRDAGDELTLERYDELRDEIESHFNEANLLLSSVAGLHHGAQSVIQNWRERIMTAQIEFCLKHNKINEMRKLRAILSAAMGGDLEAYSYKMRTLIHDMETALLGVCHLQVESDPPGADVMISFTEQTDDGVMVTGSPVQDELLYTPVYNYSLGKGTYIVTLRLDGAPDLSFPVTLKHGESKQLMIDIPREVPDGMVYIPGGPCLVGGSQSPSKREYEPNLEPFFISRREVTNREYIAFWLTLQDTKLLNAYMSRVLLSRGSNLPKNAWNRNGKPIAEIDLDKPVVGIPREAAQAYGEWYGSRHGRPCRLPTAEEWEKAARGTDGRLYPWGNVFVNNYAFTYENVAARKEFGLWAKPESFPMDVSPYGVYDMAGNVREWTSSDFPESGGAFPQIKGASSSTTSRYLPLERADDTAVAPSDVGFRLVMPYLSRDTASEEQ
jgi:serine/threonine protein kinase/formylglycine-generating enzyme required for sulfatase activity